MPAPRNITKSEVLRGLVDRVVFHNEDNGYCILKIVPEGKRDVVSLIGKAPRVVAGEEFEAKGVWEPNRDFGPQFKAEALKLRRPDSLAGIERYLGSGLIEGIGPKYAKRMVEKFGPKIFDIIENESKKLEDVEGVGKKRRVEIRASWIKQKSIHGIMLFLHQHGISSSRALRIYKTYGEEAQAVLKENPYRMAQDIRGIGFKTADDIAYQLGVAEDAPERIRAGILHVLETAAGNGHCCFPETEVIKKAAELLGVEALIAPQIDALITSDQIERHGDFLYLPYLRAAEQSIAANVKAFAALPAAYPTIDEDAALGWVMKKTGKELAANDDNPLHLQDPLVSVKLPRSGVAYVEVQRSVFGPDDRAYCVHIGTNRRPLAAFPPGGPSGTVQRMRLLGDPLGEYQERISVPENPGTFEYFGEAPSPLLLRSSPYPNVLEDPGQALNHVEGLPAALNGVISKRGEVDTYQVAVKQGDRLRVRVFAASLGSPVDPRLRIRSVDGQGQSGAVELEADDASLPDRDIFGTSFRAGGGLKEILDPSVIWEPKNDGAYRIELEDMSGSAGPTAVYRIEVEPAGPAVHTLLTSTGFDWVECVRTSGLALPQGNRWTVNVNLPQGQGSAFRGELKLVASGLPEGVELVSTQVPAGRSVWPVQFVAGPNSVPGSALITLKAQPVNSSLEFQSQSQQNLPFLNHSGGDAWRTVRLDRYVLAVTDPAPFSIELAPPTAPLVRGGELALGVKLTRREGFHEPVEFQCDWVPPGVSVGPAAIIGPDETHAVLRLSGEPNAPVGPCPIVVTASSTRDDMDGYLGVGRVRVSSEFVKLTIAEPFVELVSQPESVRRGERKPYIWTVQRVGAFEGEATIRLVGLPKGVSVVEPLPTINSHSQQVAFQIEASEEALLGSVQGVTCEATIEAGGQQILQRTGRGTLRIDPKK